SIGQAKNMTKLFEFLDKNMTKLFEFLDGKLKFPMNYVRITNEPLSAEHMRNISMDNASDRSLKILQSIGNATAIKAKMDPKVERFFTTGKTLYF
ncbi:patatin, partial [Phocaeicola vulgatus]